MTEQVDANLPARPDDAAAVGFARRLAGTKPRVAKREAPPMTRPDDEAILQDIKLGGVSGMADVSLTTWLLPVGAEDEGGLPGAATTNFAAHQLVGVLHEE